MLSVPGVAVPLSVPVRRVPLAVLSCGLAQEGEGEESGRATVVNRLAIAGDTAGTTDRAHQPLRVAGDEGTRAPALTCPITGVKGRTTLTRATNVFYEMKFYIYYIYTPIYCRFLPNYSTLIFLFFAA